MVRSFVNDIALALQEYGQLNNYNLSAQFYQDLAWGGLEGTSAFKNLSWSDRNRISNTILIEISGKDASGQAQTPKGQLSGC
ncbi:hypothetical protein [Pontibacter sp. H249]|uniref:hypothetical protein n=1 Tax=Pontibacter sp. H249 TaxID=3133420 RepID=UPI0030BBA715